MSKDLLLIMFLLGFMTNCASTRVVKQRPGKSGIIMVREGMIGDARSEAKSIMKRNCGHKRPIVIEEGEAVVGSSTRGTARTGKGLFGLKTTRGRSKTRNVTEWRVKYKCKGKKYHRRLGRN